MLLGANRKRNLVYTFFLTLNFKDRIEATNSDSSGQPHSRWKIVERLRFNGFYGIQPIKIAFK